MAAIAQTCGRLRATTPPGTIALVPTMGALHGGHLALIKKARQLAKVVIVSIYVNPLQFAPNEDFADYPRGLAQDCAMIDDVADVIFAPDDKTMYPQQQTITLSLPPLAAELCGRTRPGFFEGVAVAVCKLLNITRPDYAVFGKKDYQQWRLMEMMVQQLNIGTEVIACETVREKDGLALSSRNAYLTPAERKTAPLFYKSLQTAAAAIANGKDGKTECARAQEHLSNAGFTIDYLELRDAKTLSLHPQKKAVITAASTLGKTRLLDNIELTIPR